MATTAAYAAAARRHGRAKKATALPRVPLLSSFALLTACCAGHTEAIKVTFDTSVVSLERLLEIWASLHNPFFFARKAQYQSAVWWHSPEQEAVVRRVILRLESQIETDDLNALAPPRPPIRSLLAPAGAWWDAEERHQKWMQKRARG